MLSKSEGQDICKDWADLGKLTELGRLLRDAEAPSMGEERATLTVKTKIHRHKTQDILGKRKATGDAI